GTGTSDGDNPKAIGSAQKAISIAQDVQGEVFGALTKSGAVKAAFSIPGQIAATALDFAKAKAEGASNAAAAVTAASGTVQSLSFGVMGAIAGFAIAGPVGAAVGPIAGGIAGGIYGGLGSGLRQQPRWRDRCARCAVRRAAGLAGCQPERSNRCGRAHVADRVGHDVDRARPP